MTTKTELFIQRAREIHGNKYDYSKVEYVNCMKNVVIICKNHGDFEQKPIKHINAKQGCRDCGNIRSANNRRGNTEEFIKRAKEIHGDKYDYSKVEYVNSITNVTIICKIHGDFQQKPVIHLSKKKNNGGCKTCFELKRGLTQRYDTEIFIKKAKEIHGDKYDYSKVEYNNSHTIVTIVCKEHSDFKQIPGDHLQGHGCSKCYGNKKSNTEEFIQRAKEIHGDKYDYSKVEYVNSMTNVVIICKNHGDFKQKPVNHINGKQGCIDCGNIRSANIRRGNIEEFIQRAKEIHGDKYDYSKVEYVNCMTNVVIICKNHGDFKQKPVNHIICRAGCKDCAYDFNGYLKRMTKEEFIKKANEKHGDKYDYSKVEYVNSITNVTIICKIHGDFQQKPGKHVNSGHGCHLCVNKTEGKLYEKLQPLYPSIIQQFKQDWCKNINHLSFDFCIPEHNIIIELDGRQHFEQVSNWSSPEEQLENDKCKEKKANDNNYSVIRILQEDVFYDTYDWCKKICDAIEEIINGDDIVNIYLCENDEYKDFY